MEPLLENISAIIPDEKIDRELSFPQPNRGPRHQLKPSQMYRIHLLLCLKRLASFRQLREDLLHHRDWRTFARLKNKHSVPPLRALSEFRQRGSRLIRQINRLYLKMIFSTVPVPSVIVTVPDSTDIRAATKGYTKKLFLHRFLRASSILHGKRSRQRSSHQEIGTIGMVCRLQETYPSYSLS